MQSSGVPYTARMLGDSSAPARRAFSGVHNFSKAFLDLNGWAVWNYWPVLFGSNIELRTWNVELSTD